MLGSILTRRAALLGSLAGAYPALAAPQTVRIPLYVANNRCILPVTLDGQTARMVLDTGAERSVITRAAVRRLGLKLDPWVDTTLRGAGGMLETHANADVRAASLGGAALYQRPGSPALSLAVTRDLPGADGLLGGDLLQHVTLDLDFPQATLTLGPARIATAVPLRRLWPDLLLAQLQLDGCSLTALLDTGATNSLVNARGLHRLGLALAGHAVPSWALGGAFAVVPHRFTELRIGALTLPNPILATANVPEPAFDMILGMDVLGRQRLILSYTELKLALLTG